MGSERPKWVVAGLLYLVLFARLYGLTGITTASAAEPQRPMAAAGIERIAARLNAGAALSPNFFGEPSPILSSGGPGLRDGVDVAIATLVLEAVGEGFDGMVAVAEVIRNRAARSGKSYGEVCLKPYQFSCWNDAARAREFLDAHRDFFEAAYRAWLASAASNRTRGATFYHADSVSPSWASDFTRSARVGRHIFYRQD